MDISDINNVAHAWASWERDEANKGKGHRSRDWRNKADMRKDAAQKALILMALVAVLTALSAIFIKIFGKVVGALMIVVLALGLPICWFIQDNYGYNVQWLPLWIVGFTLMLKIFTKVLGRKWGVWIGVPFLAIIGVAAYVENEKMDNGPVPTATVSLDSSTSSKSVKREEYKKADEIKIARKRMEELVRQIKSKTDEHSGSVRAREIKRKFDEIINGFNSYTAEEACVECYKYADAAGWLKDTKVQNSAKKKLGG